MARSHNFALIRLEPDAIRGERLNIGAIVIKEKGVDVRITRRLERARALSAAVDLDMLSSLLMNLHNLDELNRQEGIVDPLERLDRLSHVGPLTLSQVGSFVAEDSNAYEDRVTALVKAFVEPEPLLRRTPLKRTRLFSTLRQEFRRKRILARPSEGLESHRIVAGVELADGLVADMVLRNGAYHVIETVDASGDVNAAKRTVSDIAVAALVLERARMKFAKSKTTARLVFTASASLERIARPALDAAEHQGAELVNWASAEDRDRFVSTIFKLAIPISPNKRVRFINPSEGGLFQ